MTQNDLLSGFHDAVEIGNEIKIPVFINKNGDKPLIILHELPGMSKSFIDYCRRKSDEGFKVYMPPDFQITRYKYELGSVACLLRNQ